MQPERPTDRLVEQQRTILVRYGGLGMELAGGILGFVLLGWWADRSLRSHPIGIIVGSIIGCVGGLYHTVRRAIEMQREFDSLNQTPPKSDDDPPPA